MAAEVNRRNFLKTAALAAGPALISARGANQKVNIGWIGVGTRGNAAIEWLHTAAPNDVALTAVCDTYQGYIARARNRVKTVWGNDPATYVDYRELLADRNVDAVFIMTPEHLHRDMAVAALKRGSTFNRKAAGAYHRGRFRHCARLAKVRQSGAGGHAEPQLLALQEGQGADRTGHDRPGAIRARLLVSQLAAERPGMAYVIPPEATPENTDWNRFLGAPPSEAGARNATSSGGYIGIIRAAFPPTCWCTRPTSSISCSTRRRRKPVWLRAEYTAGTTTATCPTPSAPFTNTATTSTSTTVASSATTITAMASRFAATRAPSKS